MDRQARGNNHGGFNKPQNDGAFESNEITSKQILIENKRYFVDLRENQRGRFIKIVEADGFGAKNKLTLSTSASEGFVNVLRDMAEFEAGLSQTGTPFTEGEHDSKPLKSESFKHETRLFYFDLRSNQRGRFLKISQVVGQRTGILVPSSGINQMSDIIRELSDDENFPANGPPANEKEIISKQIDAESKRFYIDFRENDRGKFVKVVEADSSGSKFKIILPIGGVFRFRQCLEGFIEFDQQRTSAGVALPQPGTDPATQPPIKSQNLTIENKRFFLDMRENSRGRFVKISQVVGQRTTIVIPAAGLAPLRDTLSEVLEADGGDYTEEDRNNVQVQVENKRFYFDVGSNIRGKFVKITEVTPAGRSQITVPASGWEQFAELFSNLPK